MAPMIMERELYVFCLKCTGWWRWMVMNKLLATDAGRAIARATRDGDRFVIVEGAAECTRARKDFQACSCTWPQEAR